MKPYYEHAGITIFHCDCREILPALGVFDLVLTDPPYGAGIQTDRARRRGVIDRRIGHGLRRHDYPPVFGDDAPFDPAPLLSLAPAKIVWGANWFASKLPDSPMWLAWDRVADDTDTTDIELAWVSGHRFTTVRVFRHQWCGVRRKTEAGPNAPFVHPTQKPVALMRWCLDFFPDAQTVVDPYMGSGPVARACKDAGKRYVGIEIEERYCEIAAQRLAQETLF